MRGLSHVEIDLGTVVGIRPPPRGEWTGCLLHGFGASAQDLVPLCSHLGGARRWFFPHAPVPIQVSGLAHGRAWFPRDDAMLEEAVWGTYFTNLEEVEPPGLSESASETRALIDSLGLDWSTLVLGGFSQGAMVGAEIVRQALVDHSLKMPAAVLLFSGALIANSLWDRVADSGSAAARPLIWQSHGQRDAVLSIEQGLALRQRLDGLGLKVLWHQFDGGHEIPGSAIDAARAAVQSIVQ